MAAALLDIATNFASGEEAVGAIFPDNDTKGKWRDEAPGASASHFSKKCTELPSVGDSKIVQAFLFGTTCRDLVQELGQNVPTSAAVLLDIATNFASGEDAVGAIFPDNDAKGKRRDEAPGASAPQLSNKKKKGH